MIAWHEIVLLLFGGLAGLFVVFGRRHTTAAGALGLVILCVGATAWACATMVIARLSAVLGLAIVLSAPLWSGPEGTSWRWRDTAPFRKWAVILTVAMGGPAFLYTLLHPVGSKSLWGAVSDTIAVGPFADGRAEMALLAVLAIAWFLSLWGKRSG